MKGSMLFIDFPRTEFFFREKPEKWPQSVSLLSQTVPPLMHTVSISSIISLKPTNQRTFSPYA